MLCALVVLIGHDLVPHQHTPEHSEHTGHHSHPHPSDKSHANDAGHDHEITFVAKAQSNLSTSKGLIAFAFIQSQNVTSARLAVQKWSFPPDIDTPLDTLPLSASGSRAPPAFIA
jgi:hypothetical protein